MIPEPHHVAEVRACYHEASDLEHAVFLLARVCRCLEAMADASPNDGRALERKAQALAEDGRELLELPVDWQRRVNGSDISLTTATYIAAAEPNDLADVLGIPADVFIVANEFARDVSRAWLFDDDLFSNRSDLKSNTPPLSLLEQGSR